MLDQLYCFSMKEQQAIQQLLKASLIDLQKKNPSYSLRSFAKKLEIHVGSLSSIMNGKRNVSRDIAEKIVRKLLWDPQSRTEILDLFPEKKINQSLLQEKLSVVLEASQSELISDWEYNGVLSLMDCSDFSDDPLWISKRLGITESRAIEILRRLLSMQLIKRSAEDKLVRVYKTIKLSDNPLSSSLKRGHESTMDLAKQSLHREEIANNDFSYITLAIDPSKLEEAKEMIRRFQESLTDFFEAGEKTEVYRFSTQLFPLTKLELED